MSKQLSELVMYGDLDQDGILYQLGEIFHRYDKGNYDRMETVRDINHQTKQLPN